MDLTDNFCLEWDGDIYSNEQSVTIVGVRVENCSLDPGITHTSDAVSS